MWTNYIQNKDPSERSLMLGTLQKEKRAVFTRPIASRMSETKYFKKPLNAALRKSLSHWYDMGH